MYNAGPSHWSWIDKVHIELYPTPLPAGNSHTYIYIYIYLYKYTAIKQWGGRNCMTALRILAKCRKDLQWRRAENRTLCSEGVDSRVQPPEDNSSRCRVDTGQECRVRRGALTKQPQPPAWSQGSTNPEYFMAPPSTKRLQNWPGSFGAVCSLKVRTWKQRGWGKKAKHQTYIRLSIISLLFFSLLFFIFWRRL